MSKEIEDLVKQGIDALEDSGDVETAAGAGDEVAEAEAQAPEETTDISATSEDGGEEPSEPEVAESETDEHWATDADVAYASGLGLNEEQVKSFSSREDYEMAARLLDQRLVADSAAGKLAEPAAEPAAEPEQKASEFKRVELDADEYDEGLISAFNTIQDQLEESIKRSASAEERLQTIQQAEAEQFVAKASADFEKVCDEFDSQVFGSGDLSNLQDNNRTQAWNTAQTLYRLEHERGNHVAFDENLFRRAAQYDFANQLGAQANEHNSTDNSEKILKQAKSKLGSGRSTQSRRLPDHPDVPQDAMDYWREAQLENGNG